MERIRWIDFLRGIAMIMILVFHTEVYYKDADATQYYVYTTNAIILFYFISGYLFFNEKDFNVGAKIHSIFRLMLVPYFVFTPIIALLKNILYDTFDLREIIITIISGRASWFIAALIVAELCFSLLLVVSRGKSLLLFTVSIICFASYYLVPFNLHNYWRWQDALLTIPFLLAGYMFHKHENQIAHNIKPIYLIPLTIVLIIVKLYEMELDLPMRNIAIENIPLFVADSAVFLLLVISAIRYIPRCKLVEWTGSHCIVYYFLCGGCPVIVSRVLNKIGLDYNSHFCRFAIAVICCYILATFLTWLIYKYVPFIVRKK